ncbi:MAG TPA: VWA domain-containing protein, partial [Pyrinomonadaceae bacterium]|nr:VWA domain-containing protein [Pyrinomonadaceae bacterium]
LAQNSASDNPNRLRALILVTDGEDRGSRRRLDELLALLREKKIRVYVVGLVTQLEKKSTARSTSFLVTLANETGGRAFFPKTVPELKDTANEMLGIIRN